MTRVLVTGARGAAGIAVIRSLLRRGVEVFAADEDRWASGLYLVPPAHRRLLPADREADIVDVVSAVCARDRIDVLVSTVDAELPRLVGARDELASAGTLVAAPSSRTLDTCLDKFALVHACAGAVRVPRTELLGTPQALSGWDFPVLVTPRRGGGAGHVRTVASARELDAVYDENDLLVQELRSGQEYSVDVLADSTGHVVAAVPRMRIRVQAGVAVAGRTVLDDELAAAASAVARAVGLTSVANVRLRRGPDEGPSLLDVNPRFSGGMPLTIAAGVDMPALLLDEVLGRGVPHHVDFVEVAGVRHLEDVFLPVDDMLPAP